MDADERTAAEAALNETWAGQTLLEEIHQAEMRAAIEQYMAEGKAPHRQRLAREIGLSVHRLRLFLDGADLHPHEWDRVAKWCEDKPVPRVSPYAVALGVLCHWFPPRLAYESRRALASYVRRMYESSQMNVPGYARAEIEGLFPARRVPEHD